MSTVEHTILRASRDRRTWGGPLAVYITLHCYLDTRNYRIAKAKSLAADIGIKASNVSRAIARLVKYGYLERGPDDGPRYTYRLTVSPPAITSAHRKAA